MLTKVNNRVTKVGTFYRKQEQSQLCIEQCEEIQARRDQNGGWEDRTSRLADRSLWQ